VSDDTPPTTSADWADALVDFLRGFATERGRPFNAVEAAAGVRAAGRAVHTGEVVFLAQVLVALGELRVRNDSPDGGAWWWERVEPANH
jgi:hypothetical protein